jgi:hypothetical protein
MQNLRVTLFRLRCKGLGYAVQLRVSGATERDLELPVTGLRARNSSESTIIDAEGIRDKMSLV